jgi:hypothetical protein
MWFYIPVSRNQVFFEGAVMRCCSKWLLLIVMLTSGIAQERQRTDRRLILKDGSYELIRDYQIRGDRVRYLSAERAGWEELPYSLVDWEATQKFAGQAAIQSAERSSESLHQAAAERKQEEAQNPLIAPGIRLPSPDGVYLLDLFHGDSVLNGLAQNGADLNKNTRANILRGVVNPIAGPRQTIELKNAHARIQAHVPSPSVFFPLDPGDSEFGYTSSSAKNHLRIVRCRDKGGDRIVAAIDIAIYGKVKQRGDYVEVIVEPLSEYWVKVTPATPLSPGEYALVEFDGKGAMNQFVWDFGVNPLAPANPDSSLSKPDKSEPVLIKKPQKKANP